MKLKKKIAASVLTATTAAGLATGSVFGSPAEMLKNEPAIVVEANDMTETDTDAADDDEADEKKKTVKGSVRKWILQLPLAVRALVGVPLWALGSFLYFAASSLWTAVLHPVAGVLLGILLAALLLFLVFTLTVKAVFPDVPLRKIMNKENFLGVLAGTLLLAVICALLGVFWEDYPRFEWVVKLGGGALVLLLLVLKVTVGPDSYQNAYELPGTEA